jgi:SAM-dependent MidA family methyltransferase
VAQGAFLQRLGLAERAQRLMQAAAAAAPVGQGAAAAQRLAEEAQRLAHPEHMGTVYKVLALLQSQAAAERVPGFKD